MLRLQETDRFLRDYKRYQKDIGRIESLSVKEYALQLLNKLKTHCNLIDEAHNSRNNGYVDPRNIRDNIEKSVQIRKELNTIIKDSREG